MRSLLDLHEPAMRLPLRPSQLSLPQDLPNTDRTTAQMPRQWGNARLMPGALRGPAITSGAISGAPMPMGQLNRGFTYDHRLTGPYGPPASLSYASMIGRGPTMTGPAMITNGAVVCDEGFGGYGDGYLDGYDGCCEGGRRKRRHRRHYKYKYTEKPATNCTVIGRKFQLRPSALRQYHTAKSTPTTVAMAKSKNSSQHNQSKKNHRNGIKKPKTHRYPSLKGTDPKFRRNHRHALHGTMRALKEVKEGKRENA
ncbi:60s ribosomal protein l29 [Stemphylium lycopersici]|nr:60s ribosomal protein l29 [Stemphylium lycopersici]